MSSIWNLATPDIEVYVDIEDHDIDVFVDIEYSNLDIDVTVFDIVVTKKTSISKKRRYRRLELRYRVLKLKHFDIILWVIRYRYKCYSISKSNYFISDPISKTPDIVVLQRRYRRF
jgi:hypothetical protein